MKSQLNSQQSSAPSSSQPSPPIEATVSSLTASTTTATAVAAPRVVVSSDPADSNINMTIVNQSVSRKNSKVSLKSSNSSSDGCNHKDDIIASMVKDRMRELEESQDATNELTPRMGHMSRANSHDSNAATDQITHQTAFTDLTRSTNNNQIICDADDGQSGQSSNTACTNENNDTLPLTSSSGSSKGTITGGNSNRNSIQLAAGTSSNVSNKNTSSHNASDLSRKSSNSSSQTISQLKSSSGRKYSRSHQRRFHRRFPEVEEKEMLIDWFNCALIADILLQGYLYISDNYFAFYSNIFGYKTHILIPVSDVVSVTKEKTAKIFPNAVGICTDEAKYVFGSLISRESAYRLMQEVWRSALYQVASVSFEARLKAKSELNQETDSALNSASSNGGSSKETLSSSSINRTSSANSGEFKKTASLEKRTDLHINDPTGEDEDIDDDDEEDDDDDDDSDMSQAENIGDLRSLLAQRTPIDSRTGRFYGVLRSVSNISCSSLGSMMKSRDNLMLLATLTLVILFISATFLIYRASRVQSRLYNLGLDGKTTSDGQTNNGDGSYDEAYNSPWFGGINRNSLLFSNQVNRITSKLQSKIHEVTDLRVELEQLLKIVLQIQTSDSANNEQPGNCDKSLCT